MNLKRQILPRGSLHTPSRKTDSPVSKNSSSSGSVSTDADHSTRRLPVTQEHEHNRRVAQRLPFSSTTGTAQTPNFKKPTRISREPNTPASKLNSRRAAINNTPVKREIPVYTNETLPRSAARRTPLSSASSTTSSAGKLSSSISSGSVHTLSAANGRISASTNRLNVLKTPSHAKNRHITGQANAQLKHLYENVNELCSTRRHSSSSDTRSSITRRPSTSRRKLNESLKVQSVEQVPEEVQRTSQEIEEEEHDPRSDGVFDEPLSSSPRTCDSYTSEGRLDEEKSEAQNSSTTSLHFPKSVLQNYEIGVMIGEGNFAVVHQCVHKHSKRRFALKIIDKRKCIG